MRICVDVSGRVLNSTRQGHIVRVKDDRHATGGFFIFESWVGSMRPNAGGAFDFWVESESQLEQFFAEAGWEIQWQAE